MFKFCIELGDPSADGHGIFENIFVESNVGLDILEEAYENSVKKTGIDFEKICEHYEDNALSDDILKEFESLGLDLEKIGFENLEEVDENDDEGMCLEPEEYVRLLMWFIGLSVKGKFEWKIVSDDCPRFSKSFGYGLYSN